MEDEDFMPTNFIIDLLDSWGVSTETQAVFKAQDIDISCLDKIVESDIQALIPVENIKDRIKLRYGLQQYKKEYCGSSIDSESIDSSGTYKKCSSVSSIDSESLLSGFDCDSIKENENIEPVPSSSQNKRIKKAIDLKSILKNNNSGQLCLAILKKNLCLDSSIRNNLVKSIVQYYIQEYGIMTKYDFEEISSNIESEIPNEHKETYYIPSQKYGHAKYIPARGKLVDKYNNHRRKLRGFGILNYQRQQQVKSPEKESIGDDSLSQEEYEEHKIWLKFNKEPVNEVIKIWNKTSKRRINELYSDKYKSITEVVQEWPAYKLSIGYKLVEVDFNTKFPDKNLSLFKKWPEYVEKAFPMFSKLNATKKYLDILENLEKHPSEDIRDYCFAVFIGHKIIPSVKVTIKREGTITKYKPSITESIKAFILHVQNDSEVVTRLDNWRKAQLEKGLRCQPLIIIVGATEDKLQGFYVSCDNILYKIDSFLKALDVCFKVFHCLNLEYPLQAIHIWIFIQKYFYNMDLKSDRKLSGVSALISDLK